MSALPNTPAQTVPNYKADPWKWEAYARGLMKNQLKVEKIDQYQSAVNYIVNSAWRQADAAGALGDMDAMWERFNKMVEFYRTDKRSETPAAERIRAYGLKLNLPLEKIKEIEHLAAPGGLSNVTHYYEAMEKAVIKMRQPAKPPVQPAPPTKTDAQEADEAFGKKPPRRDLVNPGNWTHETAKLNAVYAELDEQGFNRYNIHPKDKSGIIRAALEVDDIHKTTLGPQAVVIKVLAYIEVTYKKDKPPMVAKFTPADWKEWASSHEDIKSEILTALNANRASRELPAIKGGSEWDLDLEAAEDAVQLYLANRGDKPAEEEKKTPPPAAEKKAAPPARPPVQPGGGNPFHPAVFAGSKLRMALAGPSGSGKTWTALTVASGLVEGGKVAVIDTERGSAKKYAKYFQFDVTELSSYHPDTYVKAINDAVKFGYSALVIDSLSHAWDGDRGILSIVNDAGGSFDKWKTANPILWRLISTILDADIHIIATMRVKTEYVMEPYTDNQGRSKTQPRKVGLAPKMKDGIEYEFDVFAEIDMENTMTVTKSRYPELNAASYPKAGKEVAAVLSKALVG